MEKIIIKNFGGLKSIEIPLNKINIFIGQQASGKSVTVKLIYFFRNIPTMIYEGIQNEKDKREIKKDIVNIFLEYFPEENWPHNAFFVQFFFQDDEFISIQKNINTKSSLTIDFSNKVNKLFTIGKNIFSSSREIIQTHDGYELHSDNYKKREKFTSIVKRDLGDNASALQIFVPAGRSFFANLQSSIFSFLSNNKAIDPFLIEFGSFYENIKSTLLRRPIKLKDKNKDKVNELINEKISEILGGKYLREKSKDYLIHTDNRKINVSFASSGQQETLPLALILQAIFRFNFVNNRVILYIEEPEAHLFPSAQRNIIELLSLIFNNSTTNLQVLITTHSPYVLTSFNNLLYAGSLYESSNINYAEVEKILSKKLALNVGDVYAYSMTEEGIESIIDSDCDLIEASYLDQVSEQIAIQFDKLLTIN